MKESVFQRIGNDNKRSILLLLLLSFIFFIGLGNLHLFDWDEINFAESAREMIKSGDYLHVQINYLPFWEKPPFFFWLQVASMKLFGINEFAARFPNAVFGFIYLITFYLIGKKHFDGRFGLIWALLFMASLLPHVYFKSGIIDPVFNYFIFLSIYFMARVISDKEKAKKHLYLALIAGVLSGLSVITKGPVGFLLLGLSLLVYLIITKFKTFPQFKYILLFFSGIALIIAIWLSLEVAQNGFSVLSQFIAYQVELFNSPVAGHAQPFYYHFVVVFFGCFPMSILALPQLRRTSDEFPTDLRRWMKILFWVVLILFSIVTTKIIHYSSMTYAPLSFLAALTIYQASIKSTPLSRPILWLLSIVGLLVSLVFIGIPLIIYNKESLYKYMNDSFAVASLKHAVPWSGYEFLIGLIFLVGVITTTILLKKQLYGKAIIALVGNTSVTLLLALFFILPKIESFTQGPAIEFYQRVSTEDCYIESYAHKSYAQYFYGDTKYGQNINSKDMNWLLQGDIDKPVYLVSKINRTELDNHPYYKRIETKGGFILYKRSL